MPRGQPRAAAPHTVAARPYVEGAAKLGFDTEVCWSGITSRQEAEQRKRGLFNYCRRRTPAVSVSATIEPGSNGDWQIKFKLHDKKAAKAYIVSKHGTDRTQWPYNPRARGI